MRGYIRGNYDSDSDDEQPTIADGEKVITFTTEEEYKHTRFCCGPSQISSLSKTTIVQFHGPKVAPLDATLVGPEPKKPRLHIRGEVVTLDNEAKTTDYAELFNKQLPILTGNDAAERKFSVRVNATKLTPMPFRGNLIGTNLMHVVRFEGDDVTFSYKGAIINVGSLVDGGYLQLKTDVTCGQPDPFLRIWVAEGDAAELPPVTNKVRIFNTEHHGTAVSVHIYNTTSPILVANIELQAWSAVGYNIERLVVNGELKLAAIKLMGDWAVGVSIFGIHESLLLTGEMTKTREAERTTFYKIENIRTGAKPQIVLPAVDLYDNESCGVQVNNSKPGASLTVNGASKATAGKVVELGRGYRGAFRLGSGGHNVSNHGVLLYIKEGFAGTADLAQETELHDQWLVRVAGELHPDATLVVHRCEQVSPGVKLNFRGAGATIKSAATGEKCTDESKMSSATQAGGAIATIGAVGLAVGCAVAVVGLCAVFVVKGVFAKRAEEKNTRDEVSQL